MIKNLRIELPLSNLKPEEQLIFANLLQDHIVYSWTIVGTRLFFSTNGLAAEGIANDVTSVEEFRKNVHPASMPMYDKIVCGRNTGKHRARMRLCLNNKEWHWWENIYFVPETDNGEQPGNIYGVLILIDHVIDVEERIAEAVNKVNEVSLRENFIANISHDIRTPLNAISGFAQLLTDESCSPEEQSMYGEIIRSNIGEMLSLIDGVVEKSQEETDGMTFKIREVKVQEIMETCYRTNSILVPSHLKFYLEQDPHTDVTIKVDPVRTRQVLNNFISNAFKFTPEGHVTLSWTYDETNRQVRIAVKDTGIGVSETKSRHLLDRFAKVNDSDKGTGLGLDICQKIVKMQGGELGFGSVEGKGSTFWFTQPAERGKEDNQ